MSKHVVELTTEQLVLLWAIAGEVIRVDHKRIVERAVDTAGYNGVDPEFIKSILESYGTLNKDQSSYELLGALLPKPKKATYKVMFRTVDAQTDDWVLAPGRWTNIQKFLERYSDVLPQNCFLVEETKHFE